jgi:hypothetical protein
LVRISRPGPVTGPVRDSTTWLGVQTVAARMCSYLFGILTVLSVLGQANRPTGLSNPYTPDQKLEAIAGAIGSIFALLGVPLLFALSVRWSRTVANKKKALNAPPLPA